MVHLWQELHDTIAWKRTHYAYIRFGLQGPCRLARRGFLSLPFPLVSRRDGRIESVEGLLQLIWSQGVHVYQFPFQGAPQHSHCSYPFPFGIVHG